MAELNRKRLFDNLLSALPTVGFTGRNEIPSVGVTGKAKAQGMEQMTYQKNDKEVKSALDSYYDA